MNEYEVFYSAKSKSASIKVEAENEGDAKREAKAQLVSTLGPPVEIRFASLIGSASGK